ncbi:HD domain-containing protein [Paucibacter sp. PLA-PC-4]|uniref:HD-GYP domain-containing protein n=1 Tax=Paucibacter sp. PLA-PC-4 TaxID=2993655 RepID=UPI00224975F9|nr:HD domain-containing phosphohydrolase [Paucibacter sp. PLA-PC-4]MCX2861546.1 HD domain-containing protein [Paucibacter sp. PLA-PC-4]
MDSATVNPHYLDHVMVSAGRGAVEASEDIVSGSGQKLLAKGAKLDEATRERLLQHKLAKPLEDCLLVEGGLASDRFGPVAAALLDDYPLLLALCGGEPAVPLALTRLRLSAPLQSLLSVYADCGADRLRHAVGVALMARALARRLLGGDIEAQRRLALAGLVHDVGDLYIDPIYLRSDTPLQAEQWKHIVTHPLVGQRVLHRMDGAGPALAELVLSHHERLDGFGYPRGLAGEQFGIEAQVLAAAEWLMGLLESGSSIVAHASVATRLIPGEFGPALLETLRAAGRASDASGHLADEHRSLEAALPQALRVSELLQRFREIRPQLRERLSEGSSELRSMLALCGQRIDQLQQSFSSAGLDLHGPEHVLRLLARSDPEVQQEVLALVREFAWRLRELERASLMRAGLMGPEDLTLVQALIEAVRGAALQPAET